MPIYEYKCKACGEHCELLQKVSAPPASECPSCKKNELERLVSAAAFHLKGSGWYVTDFRDKDKKKTDNKPSASESSDTSDKKESSSESTPAKNDSSNEGSKTSEKKDQ